jgi:hypothetical protein
MTQSGWFCCEGGVSGCGVEGCEKGMSEWRV